MNLADLALEDVDIKPYHSGKPSRISQVPLDDRPFIAWDGEGVNLDGPGLPQSYTLFGCSTGDYISSGTHLHTFDLLDFMIKIADANRAAYHVGFAFNYDSNMIVRSLNPGALQKIHEHGKITIRRQSGQRYHLQFMPGKWFSVTRYGKNYDRKTNPHDKVSVKIYDIFSFFGTSFIKAYENLCGDVPEVVREGKAARNDFSNLTPEYVHTYWRAEIDMLRQLAEELRRRMYGAGLRINQWHGPGALANYANKKNNVKPHMAITPEPVREAARYGYAGGRFEMFRLGRTKGPIYSIDINSAYPFGITQLPSLTVGDWHNVVRPERVAKFGVYHVRLLPRSGGTFLERAPGPLFHRDKMGNISFPWILDGWYWAPEVQNLKRHLQPDQYEIVEGWEYRGWGNGPRPFAWVQEMYDLRKKWKAEGNASELALKLCMNSLYGKMAQRVGWNETKRTAPTWHQLEWAGWVTSNCRAMLWDVMARIPRESILAVETDGLYTTTDPATLGIANSKELGGWEIEVYDEILYVQSGLAWLRKGDKWICKRRGLDARTFGLGDCRDYLHSLKASDEWKPYVGETTRFIGLGAALASNAPLREKHCVWQTVEREIRPGQGGKRIHISKQCAACREGYSAFDKAHDMTIRSLAYADPRSHEHDIPWENGDQGYEWRDVQDIGEMSMEELAA